MSVFYCLIYCPWTMYDYDLFAEKLDEVLKVRIQKGDMVLLTELGNLNSELFVEWYATERENVWVDAYPKGWETAHIPCRPTTPADLINHVAEHKNDCGAVFFMNGKKPLPHYEEVLKTGMPVRRIKYFVPREIYDRIRNGEWVWEVYRYEKNQKTSCTTQPA